MYLNASVYHLYSSLEVNGAIKIYNHNKLIAQGKIINKHCIPCCHSLLSVFRDTNFTEAMLQN